MSIVTSIFLEHLHFEPYQSWYLLIMFIFQTILCSNFFLSHLISNFVITTFLVDITVRKYLKFRQQFIIKLSFIIRLKPVLSTTIHSVSWSLFEDFTSHFLIVASVNGCQVFACFHISCVAPNVLFNYTLNNIEQLSLILTYLYIDMKYGVFISYFSFSFHCFSHFW